MKYLLAVCFVLALITVGVSSQGAGGRCIPGQTFQLDCNTCVCPDSGIAANAACTLIACPPSGGARYNRRYSPSFYRW